MYSAFSTASNTAPHSQKLFTLFCIHTYVLLLSLWFALTVSGFEPFWQPKKKSQGLYIFFQVMFLSTLLYTWALSCPSWLTGVRITSHSHPYSRVNYAAMDPEPQIAAAFILLTSWPQGECLIVGPLRSPHHFFLMIPVHTIEFYSKSACWPIMAFNILQVNVNSLCQTLNAKSHWFPGPFCPSEKQ